MKLNPIFEFLGSEVLGFLKNVKTKTTRFKNEKNEAQNLHPKITF
jgi:hypothetical protein